MSEQATGPAIGPATEPVIEQVRMHHPDLAGQPISVPASAVQFHRNAGWHLAPGETNRGEEWPAELQRFEGQDQIRLRHPGLGQETTVAASAVPAHRSAGWVLTADDVRSEAPSEGGEGGGVRGGLTVDELKEQARSRGLPVSGSKAELLERLRTAPAAPDEQPTPDEQPGQQATQDAAQDAAQANTESEE